MRVLLVVFSWTFVILTTEVFQTSGQDSTITGAPATVTTTTKTTTKPGVIIKEPTKKPTTPPPRESVITCLPIEITCPNGYTVQIDKVILGRRKDSACTKATATSTPGCCPERQASLNDTIHCYETSVAQLSIQQETCNNYPGKACPIVPNGVHISGCLPEHGDLSYFKMVEFHCIYIPPPPTTTSNETTVTSTTEKETTQTKIPSTTPVDTTETEGTTKVDKVIKEELPIPIIAGAAGGGLLLIIIIVLIVCCYRRRRQRIQREDMTKPGKGITPVKDIGVNYMDEEKGSSPEPDIIKTASPNDHQMYPMQNGH